MKTFTLSLVAVRRVGAFVLVTFLLGIAVGCGGGTSSKTPASPVTPQVAAPTFSVAAGTYSQDQSVTISAATSGATIYYTTDGTSPTSASTRYTAPLTISSTQTIEAIATAGGYKDSVVATAAYTMKAALPTLSVAAGTYGIAQTVTIASTTPGASIYYTIDGSTPTSSSTPYASAISVSSNQTVKAIATHTGYSNSDVATASYQIKAATPNFSVPAGTYTTIQSVTISTTTAGAVIHYTTDGSAPTTYSTLYTSPVTVGHSQTLSAIAVANGYANSDAGTVNYTLSLPGPSYTWKNVQIIAGGYVDGINFHPTQKDLIYARTDMGGAYRWDKTTSRWIPLTDWVGFANWNYLGIEAIGLDPSDPQRLYIAAGTYTNGWSGCCSAFLVSTDQGNTFTVVTNTFPMGGNEDGRNSGDRLAVDPNLGGKLYYGTKKNGLWTSTDYGAHWSQVSSFPVAGATSGAGIVFVQFVKSSGTSGSATPVIYIGVSEKDGTSSLHTLYRSTDGGATWNPVPNIPAAMATLYPNHGYFSPDGSLYMSFGNAIGPNGMTTGAIWKYTPATGDPSGAGTWTNITPPNPSFPTNGTWGYGGLAVDLQNPGTIMVMTMDLWWQHDDMFRTTDGGATWIELGATSVRDTSLSPYLNWGGSSAGVGNWAQIAIDPFNADHALYSTGATVWESKNVTASQPGAAISGTTLLKGGVTNWNVGALGIEQTAAVALLSPPSGAALISALGDVGGFVHNELTLSPPGGMLSPRFDTTNGLDFAQNNPAVIIRTGSISPWGAYSTNGGTSWTQFATTPTGVNGGGSAAVSADGSTYVWAPGGASTSYTTDKGATWTLSTGAPAGKPVFSDRVNANKFYIFDASAGTLYISTDAGKTFTKANQSLPTNGKLAVSTSTEGDLWLASNSGLYRSTNSGTSFSPVSGVQQGYAVSFGKAAPGESYPALYLAGQINGTQAIFRSTDAGASWIRINDDQHQYGWVSVITGDPRTFGRVYLGTNGRGIIYGDSAN